MDAKELYETVARLNERLRELSQEGLSRPIPVKKKEEKRKSFTKLSLRTSSSTLAATSSSSMAGRRPGAT
jgi:hypothetical protein|nr:MAG TPA: hypothetical protein [Caudoviricetes sp.]